VRLASFALGTNLTRPKREQINPRQNQPTATEHNVFAVALNERLHDLSYSRRFRTATCNALLASAEFSLCLPREGNARE
jgi:hypothetical protein